MQTITIPKSITGNEELIVMPRREYERMRSSVVPEIYLKGRAAKRLDRRVNQALLDYRTGKTKKIRSLADLD